MGLGLFILWSLKGRLLRHYKRFRERIREVLSVLTRVEVMTLFGLSCTIVLARVFVIYFLALAVEEHLSVMAATFLIGYTSLITLIPITIAGLGLREGAVVLCMVLFGALYEQAVLVAFLGRAFMLLISLVGGGWLLVELLTGKKTPQKIAYDKERGRGD